MVERDFRRLAWLPRKLAASPQRMPVVLRKSTSCRASQPLGERVKLLAGEVVVHATCCAGQAHESPRGELEIHAPLREIRAKRGKLRQVIVVDEAHRCPPVRLAFSFEGRCRKGIRAVRARARTTPRGVRVPV